MQGGVDAAEGAFVGQQVAVHRQSNMGVAVAVGLVGDELGGLLSQAGCALDDVLNHWLAEQGHEGFVAAHARAFATGHDGEGEF